MPAPPKWTLNLRLWRHRVGKWLTARINVNGGCEGVGCTTCRAAVRAGVPAEPHVRKWAAGKITAPQASHIDKHKLKLTETDAEKAAYKLRCIISQLRSHKNKERDIPRCWVQNFQGIFDVIDVEDEEHESDDQEFI